MLRRGKPKEALDFKNISQKTCLSADVNLKGFMFLGDL